MIRSLRHMQALLALVILVAMSIVTVDLALMIYIVRFSKCYQNSIFRNKGAGDGPLLPCCERFFSHNARRDTSRAGVKKNLFSLNKIFC